MTEVGITDEQLDALGVPAEHRDRVREDVERTQRGISEGLPALARDGEYRRVQVEWMRAAVVDYEPAVRGNWTIEQFYVSPEEEQTERLRAVLSSSSRGRWCPSGVYTALKRGETTVMSDTPDEIRDLIDLYHAVKQLKAKRVVINGLGLGCALRLVLAAPTVEHVDVVEYDPDVIALIGPYFADDPRVAIHEGDAYTFRFPPGTRWDLAWHDIWDNISTDNDFATLHRRYGHRVEWQGSWCREQAIESDRRWKRENAWWLNREESDV